MNDSPLSELLKSLEESQIHSYKLTLDIICKVQTQLNEDINRLNDLIEADLSAYQRRLDLLVKDYNTRRLDALNSALVRLDVVSSTNPHMDASSKHLNPQTAKSLHNLPLKLWHSNLS